MRTCIKNSFILHALIAGLGLILAGRVMAQTFTNLHSFTELINFANSDGANPSGSLILSAYTLYGTATYGGSSGNGTVFAVSTDGTGFTNLHDFNYSDGAYSDAGLITNLSGNTLYGTASSGGSSGGGTVFAVNPDGTGFTNLYGFTGGSDGGGPSAGMILSSNSLYGTAVNGGSSGGGMVFRVNIDGTGFTNLHSFTQTTDGATPGGLILSGTILYGTAAVGGSSGNGTVFAINTDGTGFTTLYSFTGGSDGANPFAGLTLAGTTLYGTAAYGRTGYNGSAYTGNGTVFAVNTDGTGFTNLHSFTANFVPSTPDHPSARLILSGNTLYGTTLNGGSSNFGTVFSLSLPPPQLRVIPSEANVILTWPTKAAGFTLQSTTNLVSPANWITVSPGPVVANGQNAVTNPISGIQQYYRLSL